jgi:hypothetical protein
MILHRRPIGEGVRVSNQSQALIVGHPKASKCMIMSTNWE